MVLSVFEQHECMVLSHVPRDPTYYHADDVGGLLNDDPACWERLLVQDLG
jgi:hypothetical protein